MTTAPTAQPCDRCGQHVLTDVSDGATSRTWLYAQASPPGLTRTSVDRPVLRNLTQHEPHGCQVTPTSLARLASALCAHLFSLRRQVATHLLPAAATGEGTHLLGKPVPGSGLDGLHTCSIKRHVSKSPSDGPFVPVLVCWRAHPTTFEMALQLVFS